MRVELLPSSQPPSDQQFLVSYLINDRVAIDAGSIGLLADLKKQEQVEHVFVTHQHIDHIEVLSAESVLDLLQKDLFNGRIWPDFLALSTPEDPFLITTPLEAGQPVSRCGLVITPVPVSHAVPTLGLVVDDGEAVVAFPSDTGPTEKFWSHLNGLDRLDAVFLEISFPDYLADLAEKSGHHCTKTFVDELQKLRRPVRWIVVHRKPRYAEQIASELAAHNISGVELIQPGKVYEFSA
jgi:ribonuclease BN (tRNA processing enzyme)